MSIDKKRLYRALGYEFKNPVNLSQALTHRSAGPCHNERLEFLGDAILNFVIAETLYTQFPDQNEGALSRLRAFLVKGETLAEIANEIHLGHYLALGPGELKTGGFRRSSILADALEALFAAIYLDSDFKVSQEVILKLYHTRLSDKLLLQNLKDPKTELQEYLQAQKKSLPVYTVLKIEGDDHYQQFYIMAEIPALALSAEGQGDTRRKAEQEAAKRLLKVIKKSKN